MMESFKVPSGLEQDSERIDDEDSGFLGRAATVGGASSSSGSAARGTVELELERHLLGLRQTKHGEELAAVLTLKKGCPGQFAELKRRLAEGVTTSQRAAAQLQQCARFFDS